MSALLRRRSTALGREESSSTHFLKISLVRGRALRHGRHHDGVAGVAQPHSESLTGLAGELSGVPHVVRRQWLTTELALVVLLRHHNNFDNCRTRRDVLGDIAHFGPLGDVAPVDLQDAVGHSQVAAEIGGRALLNIGDDLPRATIGDNDHRRCAGVRPHGQGGRGEASARPQLGSDSAGLAHSVSLIVGANADSERLTHGDWDEHANRLRSNSTWRGRRRRSDPGNGERKRI